MDNTIKGILERMNIREEDVQKLAGVKTASARTNQVSEFLTKVAEDMGAMSDQEKLEMIKQAVEELLQKKQSGQMLDPEEEQFLAEAQGMIGGGMNVMASVKMAAGLGDGPGALDANIAEQQGLMAEAFRSRKAAGIETSPSAENVKGDDEPGYQNAAAMKKDHSAPAAKTGPNATFENPKTAMAKLAEKAMYNKTVDAIADYCIEKMAYDMRSAQQAQYQEKVAAVNELKQAAELEGRFMADAFVDQLRRNMQ